MKAFVFFLVLVAAVAMATADHHESTADTTHSDHHEETHVEKAPKDLKSSEAVYLASPYAYTAYSGAYPYAYSAGYPYAYAAYPAYGSYYL